MIDVGTKTMTRSEQHLDKAIKMIKVAQEDAIKDFRIKKPTAYALYQVWKYFDEHEKERTCSQNGEEE